MAFTQLIEPLQRALTEENYTIPTPIQQQAIPILLEGKDLLGIAQTGTGKTAAFTLPLLQHLHHTRKPRVPKQARALILAPTRELAAQIGASCKTYGKYMMFKQAVIFGGVGQQPQVDAMTHGVDILIATPGRLLDLMQQGYISLAGVEIFVLDEADRMLDMGFIHDIRKVIAKLPPKRQSLFFSATLPPEALRLAHSMLHNPAQVSIAPEKPTVEKIEQHVIHVPKGNKLPLLIALLNEGNVGKAIVFTRMKHMANKVAMQLEKHRVPAAAIHGNKSQSARTRALDAFRSGKMNVLVATDIAARGIDVEGITHVFNYELPDEPETYVHRIGRTARAGAEGVAISFCDPEERSQLRDIERLIRKPIPAMEHAVAKQPIVHVPQEHRQHRPQHHGSRRGSGHKGRRR